MNRASRWWQNDNWAQEQRNAPKFRQLEHKDRVLRETRAEFRLWKGDLWHSGSYKMAPYIRVTNRRSPRVTFWWPEDITPREAIGNAHELLLKSKLVREALKAKGYDLEEIEEGKAVVEHELMRFCRSWRTKSPWTQSGWTMSLKPR